MPSWETPPHPFCLACGVPLGFSLKSGVLTIHDEIKSQKTIDWCNYFRTIADKSRKPSHPPIYFLSGIGYLNHTENFYSLRVPAKKHGPADELWRVRYDNPWKKEHTRLFQGGIPIHAHCWDMIERIFGPVAEEELELFGLALRQRFKSEPFEVEKYLTGPGTNRRWYLCAEKRKRESFKNDPERFIPVSDPVNVPEISSVIKKSRRRLIPSALDNIRSQAPGFGTASMLSAEATLLLTLPLDIQFLILDALPPWPDTHNAVEAFNWHIPDWYWKGRICRHQVFELDTLVPKAQERRVDWSFLFIELGKIYATSDGFKNRLRIVRVLEGTKDHFFSLLESERSHGNEIDDTSNESVA